MQIIDEFKCDGHVEADSKIAFFLAHSNAKGSIIRCSDTDILIIILGNMQQWFSEVNVWIEFGTGNEQRFINVTGTLFISLFINLAKNY